MTRFVLFLVAVGLMSCSTGCTKADRALIYCLSVDHNPNLKCD